MKFVLLLVILFGNLLAFEIKDENKKIEISYEILDEKYIVENKYLFDDETSILIKFNEVSSTLVNEFEDKYSLELQEVLIVGYYIYKSDLGILDLMTQIVEEENVNTAKPNWKTVIYKK